MGFEEKVWELMKKIPEGKITSYKIIAEKMNSKAYRAVGNACRRNPRPPEIPCHRVVNSDGRVGGFGGETTGKNIEKKINLLRKEGVQIIDGKVLDFEKKLYKF